MLRLQEQGRECGAERERVHRRNQGRDGNRERELAEERTDEAGEEGTRNEDGGEYDADGHDGPRDVFHGADRGFARREPEIEFMLHGLDHHDGIVHDDADREYEAEEREVVDAETGDVHCRERPDDGDRHGQEGNDRGPPRAEEHEYHECHEHDRIAERVEDLLNRSDNERSGVVADLPLHTGREVFFQLPHLVLDGRGGLDGVGIREQEDAEAGGGLAIEARGDVRILGAEYDASHILDANQLSRGSDLEHDVAELLLGGEPADAAEGDLECLFASAAGTLSDLPGNDLRVLGADRGNHVAGSEAEFREFVGVHPDPHRVVALAENRHVADAGNASNLFLQMERGVVAQVQLVVASVGAVEADGEQEFRRALARGEARLANFGRKLRHRQRHAVEHANLTHVQVGAGSKCDRERIAAVVRTLRSHVHHVFDAVHLLLDRRGDRVRNGLRIRTRKVAIDLNRGGGNLRVLSDGKLEDGERAGEQHHGREHRGEDRTVDEVTRYHKGPKSSGEDRYFFESLPGIASFLSEVVLALGFTFIPARTRWRPLTMMRSPAARPSSMTRSLPSCGPSFTRR